MTTARRLVALTVLLIHAAALAAEEAPALETAETLYRASKWTEAREVYLKNLPALAGNQRGEVLNRIGITWLRDQRTQQAMDAFRQTLAECPDAEAQTRGYARLQLGRTLNQVGKTEEAIEELKQTTQMKGLTPLTLSEAYLSIASPYTKLERWDDALAALQAIREVEGVSSYMVGQSWMSTGRVHQTCKRYAEAIHAFEQVIATKGTSKHQQAYASSYIEELKGLLEGDQPFYLAPYVVEPASTTATLIWVAQDINSAGKVSIGADGQAPREVVAEAVAIKGTACHRYTARLEDLQAGTRYHYTAHCGGQTREGSFLTTHDERDRAVTFAVLGDTQTRGDLHRMVAEAIAKDHPDIVLHVGDLTDRGATWGKWKAEMFGPAEPYLNQSAFAAAVGNHDGGPYFPALLHRDRDFYFSFTHGNAHVMVLDSYWTGNSAMGRGKQLAWLKQELEKAGDRWKIIVLHVPMIATSTGNEHYWWGQKDFLPLMHEMGVDLVLSGHHPMYRRYLPIGLPGGKPIMHVTSGGGGPVGNPIPSPMLAAGAGKCHHSFITVKGNRLELVAKLPDGTVIDQFDLVHDDKGKLSETWMKLAVPVDTARSIRHLYQELLTEYTNTLMVDVDGPLTPGAPARLVIDAERLPRGPMAWKDLPPGLRLVVEPAPGSPWKVEPAAIVMTQPRLAFTAICPPALKVRGGRLTPGLEVSINLELDGRRFMPHLCQVVLHPDAAERAGASAIGDGTLPAMWGFRFDPQNEGEQLGWHLPADPQGDWRKASITQWQTQAHPVASLQLAVTIPTPGTWTLDQLNLAPAASRTASR